MNWAEVIIQFNNIDVLKCRTCLKISALIIKTQNYIFLNIVALLSLLARYDYLVLYIMRSRADKSDYSKHHIPIKHKIFITNQLIL